MPKAKADLDLWMNEALAAPGNGELSLSVPLHVLFGEAVDVARFHKTYWKPEVKDGKVVRRGLEMAASKKKNARISTVRAAARFVFRDRPDIARESTSAYERRRRAEAKRRAKKADAPLPL